METHQCVVIVDATPPPTNKLQIDTTRLIDKKRKHRHKFSFSIFILNK